jgi:predicted RND superfamily exporter protein
VYVQIDWETGTLQANLLAATRAVEEMIKQEPMLGEPLSIHGVLQSLADDPGEPIISLAPLRSLPEGKLDRLIDTEQHETVIISHVRDLGTKSIKPLTERLNGKFRELEERWPRLHFQLTGWTVTAGRLSSTMLNDMLTSLYLAVFISFVILAVAFRSLRLGLVSFVPNLFPLVATGAAMVAFNLPLQFSTATVFSVCFGIAVDDTIHFLAVYTHEVRTGTKSKVAIRRTLVKVGEALVVSTLIMLAAFAVVVFSSVPSISFFALVFMIVLAWALVGDLLFLPALLSLLPDVKRKSRQSSHR